MIDLSVGESQTKTGQMVGCRKSFIHPQVTTECITTVKARHLSIKLMRPTVNSESHSTSGVDPRRNVRTLRCTLTDAERGIRRAMLSELLTALAGCWNRKRRGRGQLFWTSSIRYETQASDTSGRTGMDDYVGRVKASEFPTTCSQSEVRVSGWSRG